MITPQQADAIWTVLVEDCGAKEDERMGFSYATYNGMTECRFEGNLGFGGKLYIEADRWRVDCYPEDLTPERKSAIDATNARLAALREGTVKP